MKIEDDLRATLKGRAGSVMTDDPASWVAFERRGRRRNRSRRVAAAVVAVAVTMAAFAFGVRAFRPSTTTQPAAMPSYPSVEQIESLLHAGGAGCTHRGAIWGLITYRGVRSSGTCLIDDQTVTMYVFNTADALTRAIPHPRTQAGWNGVYWVHGADWFVTTDQRNVAQTVQAAIGGEILGGAGSGQTAGPTGAASTDPYDWPSIKHVQVIPQRVMDSTTDRLVVEAPAGQLQWKLKRDCTLTAGPVAGGGTGGAFGLPCGGGSLSANVVGFKVAGAFYDVIRGHADYGHGVRVRVRFVDGTTAYVQVHSGLWMIVFSPKPVKHSPSSPIATVEAVSSTGQVLESVNVP